MLSMVVDDADNNVGDGNDVDDEIDDDDDDDVVMQTCGERPSCSWTFHRKIQGAGVFLSFASSEIIILIIYICLYLYFIILQFIMYLIIIILYIIYI